MTGFCSDRGLELEGPGSNLGSDPWGGRQSLSVVAAFRGSSLLLEGREGDTEGGKRKR